LENIEQRQAALRIYGYDKFLEEVKTLLIHKSQQYELYDFQDGELKYGLLKYKCPSTNRVYVSLVPPTIKNADEAVSWKFPIFTLEEFLKLDKQT